MRVVFNIKIYYLAKTEYPEFEGLKGCKYPGTPAPRQIVFTPRDSVPSDLEKINFKSPDKSEKDDYTTHYNSAIQIILTPASPT